MMTRARRFVLISCPNTNINQNYFILVCISWRKAIDLCLKHEYEAVYTHFLTREESPQLPLFDTIRYAWRKDVKFACVFL